MDWEGPDPGASSGQTWESSLFFTCFSGVRNMFILEIMDCYRYLRKGCPIHEDSREML